MPDLSKKFQVAVEHCQALVDMLPRGHFLTLRKHLSWYCKGFENATALRMQLMRVNSPEEVKQITEKYFKETKVL